MIDKIHYKLCVECNVDKQPTISVGCTVNAHIYFKDGRVVEHVEFTWNDSPYLKDESKFTKEEVKEINNLINNHEKGFWKGVTIISERIDKMEIIRTIREED